MFGSTYSGNENTYLNNANEYSQGYTSGFDYYAVYAGGYFIGDAPYYYPYDGELEDGYPVYYDSYTYMPVEQYFYYSVWGYEYGYVCDAPYFYI